MRELHHEVEVAGIVDPESNRPGGSARKMGNWLSHHAPRWLYELVALGYNLYGFTHLLRRIARFKPDVIYERYALNTFCGIWAARVAKIPHVLEVNAPLALQQRELGRLSFPWLASRLEAWICSNSTWTIAVTECLKDCLVGEGARPDKIRVVPNGIDPRVFHPDVPGEPIRSRYGLSGMTVLGFVGWFRPWHGLEMLIELMGDPMLRDLPVHLLLVGDGPAGPDLKRMAADRGVTSRVTFSGGVDREEVALHVAAMDVAIQPSAPRYACPMKIIEYMGMGRCIVAADQPNIRELLDDGRTGYLFTAGSFESLKGIVLDLVRDPERRALAARRAHEEVFRRKLLWSENARLALDWVRPAREGPSRGVQEPSPT